MKKQAILGGVLALGLAAIAGGSALAAPQITYTQPPAVSNVHAQMMPPHTMTFLTIISVETSTTTTTTLAGARPIHSTK